MIHFLNPFPDLLTYNLYAPIILRVVLGYLLISYGSAKIKNWKPEGAVSNTSSATTAKPFPSKALLKMIGGVEIIVGIALIIGLGVQISSIISAIIFLGTILLYEKIDEPKKQSREVYSLMFIISLSLLLSGAGLLAIDLPL